MQPSENVVPSPTRRILKLASKLKLKRSTCITPAFAPPLLLLDLRSSSKLDNCLD